MPNTDPAQDSRGVVELVRGRGEEAGLCEVLPAGCITMGRAGEVLAPFAELVDAGVRLFTDDGNGVQDPLLMRRAMEYSLGLDVVLAQHCEVARLTGGAVMHEGRCCSELGLPGWPALAEELMVHRDIELSRLTGARIHLLHLSTARSVELVRAAKADGLAVTAEVTPHHLALTDEALRGYDPVFKVNPPLRTADDVAALHAGLADGTIDAIATDHAPHPRRGQGTADRRRPAGDARPGDGARRRPRRARHAARRRRRRPVVEAGGDRRGRRPPRRRRSRRATRRTSSSSTPTPRGRCARARWPAAAATRRSSAWTCAAGCVTRCSGVNRSCVTGWPQR